MVMMNKVRAIYEDGVLKPLEPLPLPDKQMVELQISVSSDEPKIVQFAGALAELWESEGPTFEEIESLLADKKARSLERLMRQISGDFDEGESGAG